MTALILSLATSGLVCLAQDNTPPAEPDAAPTSPQVESPTSTPAVSIQARDADPAAATEPVTAPEVAAGGEEVVPLIVIDDVPLTDAIRNLARQSGINFQFDPRITAVGADGRATNQPNVSIRFENVTASEALQAVLDNYNLSLVREPKAKIARITIKDPKAEEPLVTEILQLRYSDPTNLVNLVKSTLSGRSQVVADPRTSQLIITTTTKELDGVRALAERLDTPTRQVLIEARLLETSKSPSTIKGIDWSGTLAAQNFSVGNNTHTPTADVSDNKFLAPTAPKLLLDSSRGFNPNTAFLDADGVNAVLSFLNQDSDTEVVATPRAVTLDNQEASLSVTRAFPIFKITPGSANSPAGAEITYTNLGTILHVTPRIAADNTISLRVVPEVSNIDSIDRQTLNGQINTANIYAIRRIETHVMIPSGNTLVMGGLIDERTTKSFTKVPILGDLPGIGLAFRRESKMKNKSNLLIFVTPTVVEGGDFRPSNEGRQFLQSKYVRQPEERESAWDSGKPHDWTKPRN